MVLSSLPPLLPRVDAILILDGDGNRLAGKYYGDFLTSTQSQLEQQQSQQQSPEESKSKPNLTVEDLRSSFERQLQTKIQGIAARPDAAEVITVMNKTAVFCGGMAHGATPTNGSGGVAGGAGDVRVVHVGPTSESELLLSYLCEGMYEALGHLMGGQTDRNMVLDNLELVFLLIDEHCDGGIILEVDPNKLAGSVLLKDEEEEAAMMNGGGGGGGMEAANGGANMAMNGMAGLNIGGRGMQGPGDLTVAQAIGQLRAQFIAGLSNNDGM